MFDSQSMFKNFVALHATSLPVPMLKCHHLLMTGLSVWLWYCLGTASVLFLNGTGVIHCLRCLVLLAARVQYTSAFVK